MDKNVIARITPLLIFMFISVSLLGQEPENAQEAEADSSIQREDGLRIFIDCARCDMNYIRDEVPYVNYVRDVKEAQLYILETREQTGSGGNRYTYAFIGQQEFAGINDTLFYSSRPDDTRDYQRIWRTQMLKMGMMPYVAKTPLYSEVLIDPTDRVEREVAEDKWKNWVFELEAEPDFEGEESYKELELRNSVSASKITHDWKLELDFDYRYTRTKYTYDDTLYTNYKSFSGLELLVVKSLGEHWSAGLRSELVSSSYTNIDLAFDFMPSVEYNIFPYSKSTHRQLRFLYGIGPSYRIYNDTTIYDQTEELLWQQQLEIAYQVQEKWGSINVSLRGSNFFHDFSKNRVEFGGFVSIRILKGLSVRVRGSVGRINDQLSLVRGEASEAEILLQLQELQTSYHLEGGLGLTYTFGSIYNNIVNPRFGNGRRYF
ncbi:MAG: hypothetical protein KAI08_00670 [Bacteroidales bacterium]|nr:hypothetical protein [Bacteroidales bacterium]